MTQFYQHELNIARKAAGLAIKAGGSAVAKTSNTITATLKGNLFPVTAKDIDMTNYTYIDSLTGTIKTAPLKVEVDMQTVVTVYADRSSAAGVITLGKGAEVSKHSNYNDVNIDKSQNFNKAIIGYIYLKNESVAEFVGGTTALDLSGMTTSYTDSVSPLGI